MKNNVVNCTFVGAKRGEKQERIDRELTKFLKPLTKEEKDAIRKHLFDWEVEYYSHVLHEKVVGTAIIGILGTFDCIPILGRVWEKNGKLRIEDPKSVLHSIIQKMGYGADPAYLASVNPEVYVASKWGYLSVTQEKTRSPYYEAGNNMWVIKNYFTYSAGIDKYLVFEDENGKTVKLKYKKDLQEGAAKRYIRKTKDLREKFYRQKQKMQKKGYLFFLKQQYHVEELEEDRKNGLYFHGTLNGKWILSMQPDNGMEEFDHLGRAVLKSNYVEVYRNYQPEKDENNYLKFLKPSTGMYHAITYYPEHTDQNLAELAILMLVHLNGGKIKNLADNNFDPVKIPIPYTYPK